MGKKEIRFLRCMFIYEGIKRELERRTMKIDENYLADLDQKLSLIPLSYDKAFKSVFKINLDILKEFLKVTIPININDDDSINLLDSEISVTSKNEYQKNSFILVVINNKIYIEVEVDKSKLEYVSDHNFSYRDIIFTKVINTKEYLNCLIYNYVYHLDLNESSYEDVLEDEIVLYGQKTHKIYIPNSRTFTKALKLYRNLYYNKGDRRPEVIWYTLFTAKTFSELYELAKNVMDETKVQKLMEGVINTSKDEVIIHEWHKEKKDALVKYNEIEGSKKEVKDEEIKESTFETAKKLLNMKMSIEDISKATGLTAEEIKKIKNTEN